MKQRGRGTGVGNSKKALLIGAALAATGIALVAAGAGSATQQPIEMRFACALKSNGLLRYVSSLNQCKATEIKVDIHAGPTISLCINPDGSVRDIPPRQCKKPGVVLTIPPATGTVYFCAANTTGTLRYVTNPSQCTATEFPVFVMPNNRPPVAVADAYSTNEDTPLTVSAPGVLANDTDPDGDTLHAVLVSGPSHAAASGFTLNADGSFSYSPAANYNGSDSFTYKANDGTADSNTVTVSLTVNAVNDAPVANNDSASTNEDTPLNGSSVLANDTDIDSPSLTAILVSGPSQAASFALNSDGTYSYTPTSNFNGTDSFTYKANDGQADSNVATVTITVNAVNDPPVNTVPSGTVTANENEDTPVSGISVSDVDVGSDNIATTLSVGHGKLTVSTSVSGGVGPTDVTGNGTGSVTITASQTTIDATLADATGLVYHSDVYTGPDTLTVHTDDLGHNGSGGAQSDTDTVAINVIAPPPVANPDDYSSTPALGNTAFGVGVTPSGPNYSISGSVLDNDSDPAGEPLSVTAGPITSTNGGSVLMNSDGTFTYLPPVGYEGPDTFHYTLSDLHASSTGTVTLQVNNMVWYVNNNLSTDGDGRSNAPFNDLSHLNGTTGNVDASNPGVIFLYSSTTSYGGGLPLERNQDLFGEPKGLTDGNGHTIVAAGGTNPTITNGSGAGLTLAQNVSVFDVNVRGSSGNGISGSGNLDQALVNSTVDVSGNAGSEVSLSSGTGDVAIDPSIENGSAGGTLSISGRSSGTVTVGGAITDSGGTGIALSSNTGATINFTGGLAISSGANNAFSATGGGTVNVTGANNTLATTTGTALDVSNTNIGTGLTFRSISSNGSTNGILLNATGSTGGLTVTGDGSTANSGGIIQSTTGHAVSLSSTSKVSLNWVKIDTPQHAGIKGVGVHGFTLTHSTVTGFGAAHSDLKDGGVAFNAPVSGQDNVDGAVTVTNDSIGNGYGSAVDILNYSGRISDADISNDTLTSSTSTASSKGDAIALNLFGTGSGVASLTKAEIDSNTITNFPSGNGIVVQGAQTASSSAPAGTYGNSSTPGPIGNYVDISSNSITGDATNKMAGMGISASVTGRGLGNFVITNNNPISNMIGEAIGVGVAGDASANFDVQNNTLRPNSALGSTGLGIGMDVNIQADGSTLTQPTLNAIVNNNTVSLSDGYGIEFLQRDDNGTARLKLQNNNVSAPKSFPSSSIEVREGSAGNVTYNPTLCATISGNIAATGPDDGSGDRAPGITIDKLADSATSYTFGITGLNPSPANPIQTATYLASQNPASGAGSGFWGTGTVFVGEAPATQYTSCTLLF